MLSRIVKNVCVLYASVPFDAFSLQADPDFNEEARRLWDQLNLDPTALRFASLRLLRCFDDMNDSRGKWNPLDPIYRDKETGGTIYVGS